jgi:hypothetical protein
MQAALAAVRTAKSSGEEMGNLGNPMQAEERAHSHNSGERPVAESEASFDRNFDVL